MQVDSLTSNSTGAASLAAIKADIGDLDDRVANVFDVTAYGAVGNGIADDTVAIQAAVDAAEAETYSGIVYFPAGTYKITDTISTATGAGYGPVFKGAGRFQSFITMAHATADFFLVNSDYGGDFYDLYFTKSGTKTAGYCVNYAGGTSTSMNGHATIKRCFVNQTIMGFGMLNNYGFTISDTHITTSTGGYPIVVSNPTSADTGDAGIYNCYLGGSGGVGIYQTSSGGLRVENNKFNGFQYGYQFDSTGGTTSDVIFIGNSVENFTDYGVVLSRSSGIYTIRSVQVQNNEFWTSDGDGAIMILGDGYSEICINGNSISGPGTSTDVVAIQIDHGDYGMVANNNIHTWKYGIIIGVGADYIFYGPNCYNNVTTPVTNGSSTSGSLRTKDTTF